jgi:tetratricopeptide (TPR) repeat protein
MALQVELSRALWFSGQPRAAVAVLGQVLTIAPDMAEALADRGQIRVELNDFVSALEDLNSLLRLRPDLGQRAEMRAARALAHAHLGQISQAVAEVDAALVDAPNSGPVLLYASHVARNAGERARADDLLLRAREAGNPALLPHQLAEVRRALTEPPEGESGS